MRRFWNTSIQSINLPNVFFEQFRLLFCSSTNCKWYICRSLSLSIHFNFMAVFFLKFYHHRARDMSISILTLKLKQFFTFEHTFKISALIVRECHRISYACLRAVCVIRFLTLATEEAI